MAHEMYGKTANEDTQMGLKKRSSPKESISWGLPKSYPSHVHMECKKDDASLLQVGTAWAALTGWEPCLPAAALQNIWMVPHRMLSSALGMLELKSLLQPWT